MASADFTVSVDAQSFERVLEAHAAEMRAVLARMEAAAATLGQPIEGELVELRPIAAQEAPALGTVAAVVVAGAALAGSATKRVTRRSLMTLGFLRRSR